MAHQAVFAAVKPPAQASAAGYLLNTFSTTAFTTTTVNTVEKATPFTTGYQWYPSKYYYNSATNSESIILGADNSIVLKSNGAPNGNNNGQISSFSADPSKTAGFVGTGFGGGAYFEAELAFDPAIVFKKWDTIGSGKAGWPSWWGMAVEHLASGTAPGNFWYLYDSKQTDKGYAHFIETDFFEYDVTNASDPDRWGGNMADWFGQWTRETGYASVQTPWLNKHMRVPKGTDYTKFHKYGFLWVPATPTSNGYAKYYFDDVQVGLAPVTWTQYQGQAPPVGSASWAYGILDQQHIGLILGSGIDMPMTVKSVNVWQKSASQNISSGTLYDTLYDLKKAESQANLVIDSASPADFNGDTFRAVRAASGPGSLVYHLANIESFTARVFSQATTDKVRFEVSSDNVNWKSIATSSTDPIATLNGWSYRDVSNRKSIPGGSHYLRITINLNERSTGDPQIGQVRIN
jgi:hypothetical protein